MYARHGLIVCLSLMLAACAAPGPAPTPVITAIPPTPATVTPLETRLRASIDIRNPDEMVFAAGFVWVKTDNGHIVQVDPGTDTVAGELKVDTTADPNHYCQGLSTDGSAVWVCSASGEEDNATIDVVRLDPLSLQVVATAAVDKLFDQRAMPILAGKLWVLAGNGSQLVGVDTATNEAQPAIDLGTRCLQLAALVDKLVAACPFDNLVLRIDPASGAVSDRVTMATARNVAANAAGVWVAQDSALVRLDPQTLQPVATFSPLPSLGLTGDLFVSETAVWVRLTSGFLLRIDPATNAVVEQVQADSDLSGGSVLALDGSVWATAADDALLLHLTVP